MSEDKAEPRGFVFPAAYTSPELDQIFMLASTFDGYREYSQDLGDLANKVAAQWHLGGNLPDDFKLLRASLFYEARRAQFVEGYPQDRDMPYLRALAADIEKGLTGPTSP